MSEMASGTFPHGKRIVLAHGGGGQLTSDLIDEEIRPRFQNAWLEAMDDAALIDGDALHGDGARGKLAMTTDSYVVQPLEFPGGNIGELAISGTVNDLAVSGAIPRFLSVGLILEEGLELETLRRILDSMARCANEAGVRIVTGDTKVVAKGQADGLYINTAGVGSVPEGRELGLHQVQAGDGILVSGTIADHGLAVMLQREKGSVLDSELESDAAPLGTMIEALLAEVPDTRFLRDATRGGLAGVVSDLAEGTGFHVDIDETCIPIRDETRYAAEMLGLDPLDVANEGKVVAVVPAGAVERALSALHRDPHGEGARQIGTIAAERDGLASLLTTVGGQRILQKPYGEELARIC